MSGAVAAVTGVCTYLLSDAAPAGSLEAEAGRQGWWLFGLLWGFVVWMVRRHVKEWDL